MIFFFIRGKVRPFLTFITMVIIAAGIACCSMDKIMLLSINKNGQILPVKIGDIISLHYIQSMYGVAVEEKMRVEDGYLILFEVKTTDAALEYLGIEKHGAGNTVRIIKNFSIPRSSVGNYVLAFEDRRIPLYDIDGSGDTISIRLERVTRMEYFLRK